MNVIIIIKIKLTNCYLQMIANVHTAKVNQKSSKLLDTFIFD